MGIIDGIKGIYYSGEDAWYNFWDKVDSKIPVYGIIERIDKIIPSFLLFLIIIIALIGFFSWSIFGGAFAQSSFTVQVLDSEDNLLPNAAVEITLNEKPVLSNPLTNELGETETVSLPMGSTVKVSVAKEGFGDYSTEVTIESATQKHTARLVQTQEEKRITILVRDKYNQPIAEPITIKFSCKNSSVRAPSEMTITNSTATIIEPKNCNGLIASLDSSKYNKKNSVELNIGSNTVFLSPIEDIPIITKGKLRIQLKSNNVLVSEAITAHLFKENSAAGIEVDAKQSSNGIVEFEKTPATYFVKTSATSKYAQAVSDSVAIEADKTKTIDLALAENTVPVEKKFIKLQFKDELSKQLIIGASVLLKKETTDIETKKSDENGIAQFFISEDTAYTIAVDANEYCFKTLSGIRGSVTTQTIELKKFSGECGAALKVRVIDQDGKKIKNAIVGLYDEEGYSTGFANKISDINGIAEFRRVPSGNYKAFALRGNFSGWSDSARFQQRLAEQTELVVTIVIPDGTLRIKVADKDGNPLPGANIVFFDAVNNERIGSGSRPVDDVNGILDFVSRADKKVFFNVTKNGFANFTSVVYPILPETIQEINVIMEKEIISGDIKIEFLGLFKGTEAASVLAPGEEYTAKLKLKIPVNKKYKKIGLHLRTGNNALMELDSLLIKEINVPGKTTVIKATAFRPNNSYEEDIKSITSDDAKWVNAEWDSFLTGIINAEAIVKVKQSAKADEALVFFYRAWAIDEKGKYIRDKEDRLLGDSENTQKKQALYADAYSAIFNVGTETLCGNVFCFSASILDIEEGLSQSVTAEYKAKLFKKYNLNFAILNASKNESDSFFGSELRIMNEDESLKLGDYSINGAQNANLSGSAEENKIDWSAIGDFLPNTSIKGNMDFSTQKTSTGIIKFQVRSAQRIVFEKSISILVEATKELSVTIVPEFLPNGVENKITITIVDKETGQEIENALVKIEDKFKNVLSSAQTNSRGIAIITLPAQQPSEILKVVVEKPDYKRFEKEITVDDKVAALKPDKIGINLNTKTKHEAEEEFSIENKSGMELTVANLELDGKLAGLIDAAKANNWLGTFLGEKIPAKQTKQFSLKTVLTELGKQVKQTKTIEASLRATVSAEGAEWTYEVPVTIVIGLGGEVDDPNCLKISKREWKATTEGQSISMEFEIQNNCSVQGNPVALNDIEAQINWESNELGTFTVITEQAEAELVSGYFKKIIGRLEPEQRLNATLNFAPSAAKNAIAKANIIFKATNQTETASQEMIDKLTAEITITNLVECIAFDNDLITIPPEGTGAFSIQTLECGDNTEISLTSDLELSKKTLSMKSSDSAQIEVFASGAMPGQYAVSVFAKGKGATSQRFIKNIRVRVQSKGCFELSKFEFDVYQNPNDPYSGYDNANLTNHCYDKIENIKVTWSEKDMGKAQDEGMKFAMIMGLANMMAQAGNPKTLFDKATSGNASDWCMMDDGTAGGTILYKQNGKYYNKNNQEFVEPAKGMCHPWQAVDVYSPQGTKIRQEYGYLKGTQLLGSNGQPLALTYENGKFIDTTYTINPPTETPAKQAENPKPQPSPSTQPAASSAPANSIPVSGLATAALADGATAPVQPTTSGNTGATGTWAGPKTEQPSTVEGPPKESSLEKEKKKNEEDLSSMGGMAMPLMMALTSMSGGEPNFLASAMQGYLMGTQWAYSQQGEGEFSYEEILKDLVYTTSKLLMPNAKIEEGKYSEETSSDIIVEDKGEKTLEQKEENPALSIEKRKLVFINKAGIVQSEPTKPIFRVLQVRGERLEYETSYEFKEEKSPQTIKVKSRKPYVENFRLQFNSYNPVLKPIEAGPVPNCQLGALSGVTGEKAVPKILLEWDWRSIRENTCDESNPNYVYCDATQFSIEILKKLEKLKNFVEENKPFDCPTAQTAASVKEQELSTTDYDAGITRIQAQKIGNDANITITLESNNKKEMPGNLTISINDSNNQAIASKTINFNLLSKETVSETFQGIPAGNYDVNATMAISLCTDCKNSDTANDSIKNKLNMTSTGVGKCTPYNTKRLKDFLEATEASGNETWTKAQKEEILGLINFNALLIKDAYPDDFRKDFHEYCINKSFFDCPEYYSKQEGWGEYFSSKDNFVFDYGRTANEALPAGKYNVVLNIEFNNEEWNFFKENQDFGAVIKIELTQLDTPRPESPFYYMPFDGKIGIDSENGRQGYGANYRQTSEETIKINNSPSQLVTTTNIASSTPVYGAWVSGGVNKSFETLNVRNRGIIMEVKATEDATNITLSPSYATPVIMKISHTTGPDAFAFYSVEVDNAPQTTSSKMTPWNGIGINCKDFLDAGMTDAWQNTWDIHGGISGNMSCAKATEITDYGLEWCNPIKSGNVYLWSIFFTPQNNSSILKRKSYADEMQLIGVDNTGTQIALNGIPGQEFNSYGASSISSVQDVLSLIKDSRVCVIGANNRASNQFFWNPKPVIDSLDAKKKEFEKQCIPTE